MTGHELQAIFDTWSVHSKEHGEVITNENVSGFVQDVRKALAAGASEGQEPVAWLHTMHMEGGQTDERLSFSDQNPWGEPGLNYSEEYAVVSKPLTHPAAEIAALRERLNAAASLNAVYADEIRDLRERIAGMEKDAGPPVCVDCGDSIMWHDPGVCGCCYSVKYAAEADYAGTPNGTYDDHANGKRISVFNGRLTAVWDQAHFEKMPLGTFPDLSAAIAKEKQG